ALLMARALEAVVDAPAVVAQDAGIILAQELIGHAAAAGRIDRVTGGRRTDERVQPGEPTADPPAGLVGHDPRRSAGGVANGVINRGAASAGTERDLRRGAAREVDAEEGVQAAAHFAVRQTEFLVEEHHGRLRRGPDLRPGVCGSDFGGRLANGAACRLPARCNSATSSVSLATCASSSATRRRRTSQLGHDASAIPKA